MRRREISWPQRLLWVAASLIISLLTTETAPAAATSPDDLDIITVSTRPDTVSGGDVLVRIHVPPSVALTTWSSY
jgi:hypothetical protein